nr:hypothetical protein [uncultured Bifidobacterium sp.]
MQKRALAHAHEKDVRQRAILHDLLVDQMAHSVSARAASKSTDFCSMPASKSNAWVRHGSSNPRAPPAWITWQRDTMVGKTSANESTSSKNSVCGGGSSNVFRNAFAASARIRSAETMTSTFHPPESALCCAKGRIRSRIMSTPMMRLTFSGSNHGMSGCACPAMVGPSPKSCAPIHSANARPSRRTGPTIK